MEIRRKSSLLLMLLAVLVGCALGRSSTYIHEPSNLEYHTSTCRAEWCGEEWKTDRILYYNYTVTERYEIRNVPVTIETSNCSGTQNSMKCVSGGRVTIVQPQRVRTEVVSRTLTEIVKMPSSLTLGFIASDNINATTRNFIEDTYQHNRDKIWQIKIPRGCQMIIQFHEFNLETTDSCQKDYFMIQTRKDEKNIPKYCSSLTRVEIRKRRRVQIWLHSDDTVAKRGVHAVFCFRHWPVLDTDLPCNCNLASSRRRRRSLEDAMAKAYEQRQQRHHLRQQTEEEDELVGEWLISMMRNGTQKVEEYLNSSNPKQQYLAQKYHEALTAYGLNLDES